MYHEAEGMEATDTGQVLLVFGILLLGSLLLMGGAWVTLRSRRQRAEDDTSSSQTTVGKVVSKLAGEDVASSQPTDLAATSVDKPATTRAELASRLSDWQRKLPPDYVLLNRDAAAGEWIVEVEGQRYRRLSDIHDDRAAAKILAAIEGMKNFAGLTLVEDSSAPLPPPTQAAPATGPAKPARSGLATYPAPPGSIIAQIEIILQRELALHQDLLDRSIHMGAAPDGSLLIEIDRNFYKSPNDIPELRVREIVLRAVRTWEKSG